MFTWWHRIWNKDTHQQYQQPFETNASPQQQRSHIDDEDDDQVHRTTAPKHHLHHQQQQQPHHQLPYSVHHNCSNQSKCMRKTLTDHTSRMHSFCLAIILIHCLNVAVLAIASENSNNSQPQPCDRSRRVFTDMQGEISNGPPGYNYTQVSTTLLLLIRFSIFLID